MVRPPLSSQDDSFSTDNTTNASFLSESGEFTVTSCISPSPQTIANISSALTPNRYPFIEQYLIIYYKKSLDRSVSS